MVKRECSRCAFFNKLFGRITVIIPPGQDTIFDKEKGDNHQTHDGAVPSAFATPAVGILELETHTFLLLPVTSP
jgi:hypothetical protein